MGRMKLSAGRMAREPSVPKLLAVETSPPITTVESAASSPSQPDRSPSLPEPTKNNPSSAPPSNPDTKKKANKPRPEPQTRPLTLRSGKKIAPPLTRAQAKLGILENTPQNQEKQHEPPVVRPHVNVTDQPEPSRRRSAPRDFVSPAPKRKKPSRPPDNLHFPKTNMQLRNRPNRDKAPENKKKTTKPKLEKTVKMKKKTKPNPEKTVKRKKITEQRMVDEAIEDVVSSHSNGDISSLHTDVGFLTTVVLVNNAMLKEQQAQLNRLQRMVQTR